MISLNIEKTFGFISKEKVFAYEAEVKAAQEMLEKGTGKGNDFLGWLHLPSSITKEHLADLNATAKVLRDNCEVVIVAGIGGSYLGARAVIEALSNSFTWLQEKKTAPVMIYAGHNISEDYLYELTEYLKETLKSNYEQTNTDDYLAITLTDEEDIPDAINRLRSIYPNIMQLTYDNLRTKTVQNIETTDIANLKTPLNLFEELYYKQNNQNLNDKQIDILQELIQDIWEEK